VETHLVLLRETAAEERIHVMTQILGYDEKRIHAFHWLHRSADGALLATAEQVYVHVDTVGGRASAASDAVLARVARIAEAHAALPRPERAGQAIQLSRGAPRA
jgi:acyl-CoA thioesterase FadM